MLPWALAAYRRTIYRGSVRRQAAASMDQRLVTAQSRADPAGQILSVTVLEWIRGNIINSGPRRTATSHPQVSCAKTYLPGITHGHPPLIAFLHRSCPVLPTERDAGVVVILRGNLTCYLCAGCLTQREEQYANMLRITGSTSPMGCGVLSQHWPTTHNS